MSFMADYGDDEPTPGNWREELKVVAVSFGAVIFLLALANRFIG
jgi:hypothetical protein